MNISLQKGLAMPIIIVIVVGIALVLGIGYFAFTGFSQPEQNQGTTMPDGTMVKPDGTMVKPDGTMVKPDGTIVKPDGTMVKPDGTVQPDGTMVKPDGTMVKPDGTMVKPDGTMIKPDGTMVKPDGTVVPPQTNPGSGYSGSVLAGTSSPLLDFAKSDYDKAVASDKLVVLYFYANWCPICRAEVPNLYSAFNELTTDRVVGFRINYNDNQTDSNEMALARQHGITYQHTKVFVRNGQEVLKAPDSWNKDRYLTEINGALSQ